MSTYRGKMKALRRTRATLLVLCVLGQVPASAAPGEVDRIQPISAEPASPCVPFVPLYTESEWQPQIRAHPTDADRLTVIWTQGIHNGIGVGVSDDGGQTWTRHEAPISRCGGDDGTFAGDGWLAWAPDGTLHLAALTGRQELAEFLVGPRRTRVVVTRSSDGGRTWSEPVIVEDDGRFNDREALAIDPQDPQRLYVVWTKTLDDGRFAIFFSRSSDGGQSWDTSRNIFQADEGRWPSGFDLRVLPDGTVLSAFEYLDTQSPDAAAEEIALRSTDGGESWSTTTIADTHGHWPGDPEFNLAAAGHPELRLDLVGNAAPSLSVAPDGAAVVAWQDSTPDAGSINVARSLDGGATWSVPVIVRPDSLGQAWGPTIAVDSAGTIAVSWNDGRAERPGDTKWTAEVWAAYSHDDGLTWTEQRLGGPYDIHTAPFVPFSFLLGNYFGLTPMSGGFGAAFPMGAPQAAEPTTDVFFARLKTGE